MDLQVIEKNASRNTKSLQKIFLFSVIVTASCFGLIRFDVPESESAKLLTAFVFLVGAILAVAAILGYLLIRFQLFTHRRMHKQNSKFGGV
jgi:flagellar biosynthesis protein FlhB